MSASPRPPVSITPVITPLNDISHCIIVIQGVSYIARLNESSTALRNRVFEASGVLMSDSEILIVRNSSFRQIKREVARLEEFLQSLPTGVVAKTRESMCWWIHHDNQMVWVKDMVLAAPVRSLKLRRIEDLNYMDTDELHVIAGAIRSWLKSPLPIMVDIDWLFSIT